MADEVIHEVKDPCNLIGLEHWWGKWNPIEGDPMMTEFRECRRCGCGEGRAEVSE